MDEQEKRWFEQICQKNKNAFDGLAAAHLGRLWDYIKKPYSEQAHFIYELLQNADDVGATEGKFELFDDKLVFTHNGKKHFLVTNPDTQEKDIQNGLLGDFNAIVGVGNSTQDENAIGTFGIGFKSVFIYTDTPRIYDDNMQFEISNYIIPSQLDSDYCGREKGNTLFVFPFRQNDTGAAEEILQKLKGLIHPSLFLRKLNKIEWQYKDQHGSYTKNIKNLKEEISPRTDVSIVTLGKTIENDCVSQSYLLFSRFYQNKPAWQYSIGFGLNEQKDKIIPVQDNHVFCYFPTKDSPDWKFLIHAPFRLTSNRENLNESPRTDTGENISPVVHNQNLLDLLAKLLADSLEYMKELDMKESDREKSVKYLQDTLILEQIIPLKIPQCSQWEKLKLECFYKLPLQKFQDPNKELIPCEDGYCSKENAYTAQAQHITETFSSKDLVYITGNAKAQWVFKGTNLEWKQGGEPPAYIKYINDIHKEMILPWTICQKFQGTAIEERKDNTNWLSNFYKWLANLPKETIRWSRSYPFLLDQTQRAKAVGSAEKPELFLPIESNTLVNVVHPELHKDFNVQALEKAYGLQKPSLDNLAAELVKKIGPNVDFSACDESLKQLFLLADDGNILQATRNQILDDLKKKFSFPNQEDPSQNCKVEDLYWESDELRELLGNSRKWFICNFDTNFYSNAKTLLTESGVSDNIHFHKKIIHDYDTEWMDFFQKEKLQQENEKGRYHDKRIEYIFIPEIENIINGIATQSSEEQQQSLSRILRMLLSATVSCGEEKLQELVYARYFYYEWHGKALKEQDFSNPFLTVLKSEWIPVNGKFCRPEEVSLDQLPDEFRNHQQAKAVCELLGIKSAAGEEEKKKISELSEEKRRAIALGEILQGLGVTKEDDIRQAIELLKKNAQKTGGAAASDNGGNGDSNKPAAPDGDNGNTPVEKVRRENAERAERTKQNTDRYKQAHPQNNAPAAPDGNGEAPAEDDQNVDHAEEAKKLQQDIEQKQERFNITVKWQDQAVQSAEYSYAWLQARIELEILANGTEEDCHPDVTIGFACIKKDPNAGNLFILSKPTNAIPAWFAEEINQKITLWKSDGEQINSVIEDMSVNDQFTLQAHIKILAGMENLDCSEISCVETSATRPAFLLANLRKGFEDLKLDPDYDLKGNLPGKDKIKFIFGPPGTGKTTHLAEKEIIPLAAGADKPHILVLAPTNKAADVLVKRVIKIAGEKSISCTDWLFRFGTTLDSELQGNAVCRGKDVTLQEGKPAVLVTTIARFAYDQFMSLERKGDYLAETHWDYIIIDEASMIPLMWILYPLYKAKEVKKFIIAGDPMQIEPVVKSELSKGQNIYKMVELNNFASPKTEPHDYEVVRLDTQYRSIPAVGMIFSLFAYQGTLRHKRRAEDRVPLTLDTVPDVRPLTILKFPVTMYESIYRVQNLNKSCYHVYSALFTFEYICKVAEELKPEKEFRIGIISPYRPQTEIIENLVKKHPFPEKIKISVGTVHSFQGDECELIFALLNPPRSAGERAFINNVNILNVAISRARDYLIVAIPEENTPAKPRKIAELMRGNPADFIEYQTPELEEKIWGYRGYISQNTYSTGHQPVNVYKLPEKRFEIRASDDAIDIQFIRERRETQADEETKIENERLTADLEKVKAQAAEAQADAEKANAKAAEAQADADKANAQAAEAQADAEKANAKAAEAQADAEKANAQAAEAQADAEKANAKAAEAQAGQKKTQSELDSVNAELNDRKQKETEERLRKEAEEKQRNEFVVPEGYHLPGENEIIQLEKSYYILGGTAPQQLFHADESEEINMNNVLAIED